MLPGDHVRQYSLCGDRHDAYTYRVAVLREHDGRGGSAYVHDRLVVGDVIGIGGPRNNFRLTPAPHYLFVAGGIGITPILAMVRAAEQMGSSWELLYGGRSRSSMAYLDELEEYGDRVQTVPQDELGLLDLAQRRRVVARTGLACTAAGRRRCSPPSRRPAPSCRLAPFVSSGSSLRHHRHRCEALRSRSSWHRRERSSRSDPTRRSSTHSRAPVCPC